MANTTTLTVNVTEQQLELVTETKIASGGLADNILFFDFKDLTWDGLSLKAVFRSNNELYAYGATVDAVTKKVAIPAEVMRNAGVVWVGLAGSIINAQGVATLVRTSAVLGLRLEKGVPALFESSSEDERNWASVAEMWATGGSSGTPSATNNALYYAGLAESYKDLALSAKNDTVSAKNLAESARDSASGYATKAGEWAEKAVNVEVETGKYSAKHYATKAQGFAGDASNSAISASGSATNAYNSAEDAEDSAELAQSYAESIEPEKIVRKDSVVESFAGTFADMIVSQMDEDNADDIASKMSNASAKRIISQLYNEPDEVHTMSVSTAIPASMSASGSIGQVVFNSGYAYICVASNSWKRFELGDF